MANSLASVCEALGADDIMVLDFPMHNASACLQRGRLVGIDSRQFETQAEMCTALIHEGGHFLSGAFYQPYSPYQIKAQAEYRADKVAIQRFIPLEELKRCLYEGDSLWEMAEEFCVTEDYVLKAYLFYKENMGVSFG